MLRKTRFLGLLTGLTVVHAGLTALPGEPPDGRDAVDAGNRFTFDLYERVAKEKGNIVVSPWSLHAALAMTWAGARTETADEMAKVLCLKGLGDVHGSYAALLKDLRSGEKMGDTEQYRLVVANALWAQKDYKFEKAFLDMVKESYGGGLDLVDFKGATESARKTINTWVAKRTEQKIPELIGPRVLSELTRLVLTNAVYFKSAWAEPFSKGDTKSAPFHLDGGATAQVPLMHQVKSFGYLEGEGFQMVEIPYAGHALSMVVLLPRQGSSFSSLEGKLKPVSLGRWLKGLTERRVDLFLPRFKTASALTDLPKTLAAMGMPLAFSLEADFSGMDGTHDLLIQAVLHKAFVDVDEKGTEAAAASAVVMGLKGAMLLEEKLVVFRADRPFLYMIRHRSTGAILFIGRLVDPK